MLGIFSWTTLQGGIMFKRQNYYGSCFAAAYQNLAANINRCRRNIFTGDYYDIECQEYNYMSKKDCNIESEAPPKTYLKDFIAEIPRLEYSTSTIYQNITMKELIDFANHEKRYNMGFTLWIGDNSQWHAHALFIKNIENVDYYIYLDSNITYISADFKYYAQPCSNKRDALNELGLHDSLIQGGMTAYFY